MRPFALAALAAIVASPAVGAAQADEHAAGTAAPSRGFHVGFGLGAGAVFARSTAESATVVKLRVGTLRSPRVEIGLEGGIASSEFVRLGQIDAAATFYPWAERFFVRGGLGVTVASGDGPFSGGREQGPNALAGVGFALGDRRGLRLTVNADAQFYLETPFDRATDSPDTVVSGWIGVDWF